MSASAALIGGVSIGIACGRSRRARGLGGRKRITGNSICPARSSISNKPRQTIARDAPLACFHCQTSQSFSESLRRLALGFSAINWRIRLTSSAVSTRPRYLHSDAICRQCARAENGTQVFFRFLGIFLHGDRKSVV